MNLLEATLEIISRNGYTIDDIVFIGSSDGRYSCTWEEFVALAVKYPIWGLGAQRVAEDLVIRFSDGGGLYIDNYDCIGSYGGYQEWGFLKPFRVAADTLPIHNLFGRFGTLAELSNKKR